MRGDTGANLTLVQTVSFLIEMPEVIMRETGASIALVSVLNINDICDIFVPGDSFCAPSATAGDILMESLILTVAAV